MTDLTVHMAEDIDQKIEETLIEIHEKMSRITEAANLIPSKMGKEFQKKIKEMFKDMSNNLSQRNQVFLKEIVAHKAVIVSLQNTNAEQIKLFFDKAFELSSSLS